MNDSYKVPAGFDPHYSVYALKGIAYFLHEYYAEGPGVLRRLPDGHHANLLGISWMQDRLVNELYDYMGALDEAGVKLPLSDEDFVALNTDTSGNEVRDERGIYVVGSRQEGLR